jgi:DNA repair exonuclease SbcCD ATPase subunit
MDESRGGRCMDNEDVLRFMQQGFKHLEEKLDEWMKRNNEEHIHFKDNFRELYNENKLQNEKSTMERERIMNEMDKKLDSIGQRLSVVESKITTIEAEKRQVEKSRPFTFTVAGFILTAITVFVNLVVNR